jgi:Ser/Thr protein kinase RdoA (MazF antagonist)
VKPLRDGLINDTFAVGSPPRAVVQRLHPVFAPEVNCDIDAITTHLDERGMLTPRVLRTGEGDLWSVDAEGRSWRALTWVPGRTTHRVENPAMAREAGSLVARWHVAVGDLEHRFAFSRPGAHDTASHMASLRAAVQEHPDHRLADPVSRLADEILAEWEDWDGRLDGPAAISHGDLKISNLRFDDHGRALCLLDLDTMGLLSLDIELGDAWRSWCNPAGEDTTEPVFDEGIFAASAAGYLSERSLAAEEREALPEGIQRICLELSARFAADALRENYFGWDSFVAPTRGDHSLLRATGQHRLSRLVRARRGELSRALAWGRARQSSIYPKEPRKSADWKLR